MGEYMRKDYGLCKRGKEAIMKIEANLGFFQPLPAYT